MNTTELLSIITRVMSEKDIELNKVDLYEQAVSINNKVKVCIGNDWFLVHLVGRGGGFTYDSTKEMLDKVIELITENDWLPGDDIEAYGEWFTLVVEEKNRDFRLLDENYNLSGKMTLNYLKSNYSNASLEKRIHR